MRGIQKKPLIGSILGSILATIALEALFVMAYSPLPPSGEMFDLMGRWSFALENSEFLAMQSLVAVIFFIFIVLIYRKIAGPVRYKDASDYGAHGTATFAEKKDIYAEDFFVKKTWNSNANKNLKNQSGLIFGLYKGKPLILHEETKVPNRNVFVIGSPGSGKTQSYILTNIIHERERSIVVTDPKGEIYEATSKLKHQQGYEVRLINFKEMLISDRYNPIDYVTKEIEAEQVANTIVLNSAKNDKPDFWTKAEVALLKTLILYVKYHHPENPTLAKVKEILTIHGATPEDMDAYFNLLETDDPAYQSYLIVRMAEERVRASIFISLGVTLSKFDPSDVRRFMEASDFQLDDIGRKKMIVYCILPVADSTWEPLISTFFSQLFQRLYDVADRNFNRLPVKVNLLLDEFPNLGKIPNYEEILATCRSYGISASTIVQSIGQLIDKYSKEKAEAIIGNCSLRFLLGVGDKMTAEYFSELIGKQTVQTHSDSVAKKKGGGDSSSFSFQARNLLTPDELTRLNIKEAILLVSGMLPIKVQKAHQYIFFKGILHEGMNQSRYDYLSFREGVQSYLPQPKETEDRLVKEPIFIQQESIESKQSDYLTIEDQLESGSDLTTLEEELIEDKQWDQWVSEEQKELNKTSNKIEKLKSIIHDIKDIDLEQLQKDLGQ